MEKFNFLLIGDANHQYIINFVKWLKKVTPNIEISIISTNPSSNIEKNEKIFDNQFVLLNDSNFISKIKGFRTFYRRWRILKIINYTGLGYDAILVHYAQSWLGGISKQIRKKTKNYIVALWGSDFYRAKDRISLDKLLRSSDNIIIGSPQMIEDFKIEFHRYSNKVNLSYYGSEPIENLHYFKENSITRNKSCKYFNLTDDKLNVTIGHNGSKAHQHIAILKELVHLTTEVTERIRIILPLTYSLENDYHKEIIAICKICGFDYKLFTDFMNEESVAHLRNITDIMINLQITDAFSDTMKEVLYCGGLVINGSWLPYEFLKDLRVYFEEVNSVKEISDKINSVVSNYSFYKEKSKNNSSILYELSSWSHTIHQWKKVIEQKR